MCRRRPTPRGPVNPWFRYGPVSNGRAVSCAPPRAAQQEKHAQSSTSITKDDLPGLATVAARLLDAKLGRSGRGWRQSGRDECGHDRMFLRGLRPPLLLTIGERPPSALAPMSDQAFVPISLVALESRRATLR